MTDVAKRGRGRPLGTEINDQPHLERVADLLVADSSLKPRAAMIRLMGTDAEGEPKEAATLRRWQSKWKKSGEVLLVAARERAKPVTPQAPPEQVLPRESYLQAKQALENSSYMETIRDVQRAIRQGPYANLMQELQIARQMRCSSAYQMMRENEEFEKLKAYLPPRF